MSKPGLGLSDLPAERKEYSAPAFSTLPNVSPMKARRAFIFSHWGPKLIEGLQLSPLEFYGSVEEAIHHREVPNLKNCRVEWHEEGVLSCRREYLRVERGEHALDICAMPFGTGFYVSSWMVSSIAPLGFIALFMLLAAVIVLPLALLQAGSTLVANAIGPVLGQMTGVLLWLTASVMMIPLLLFLVIRYLNRNRPGWDYLLMVIPLFGSTYQSLFRPFTYYKIDTAMMFHQAVHGAMMEVIDQITKAKGIRALTELERKPVMREFFQMRGLRS